MAASTYTKITITSVKNFLHSLSERQRYSATRRDQDYYLRDTRLQGFFLRIRPSDKATYGVQSRLHGRKRTWTIGDQQLFSAIDASETAAEWLRLIKKGLDPKLEAEKQAHARSEYPVIEVVKDYCEKRRNRGVPLRESTKKTYIDAITRNAKAWANKDIRDLTVEDLEDWYNETQNRRNIFPQKLKVLRTLQAVINWAEKRGIIKGKQNVCETFMTEALGGLPEEVIRERHIPIGQIKQWLWSFQKQAKPHPRYFDQKKRTWARVDANDQKALWNKKPTISHTQRDYILFMLLTGRRAGESSQLRWSDLNMTDERMHTYVIRPEVAKGGRQNIVSMTPLVDALFEWRSEQPDRHKDWVFPNRQGTGPIVDARKALQKISHYEEDETGFAFDLHDDAGRHIEITPHDLRRTVATYAYEAGKTEEQLARVLAHRTPSVTQGYVVSSTRQRERDTLFEIEREIVGEGYYWFLVNWYGARDFLLEEMDYRQDEEDNDWGYYEKYHIPTDKHERKPT